MGALYTFMGQAKSEVSSSVPNPVTFVKRVSAGHLESPFDLFPAWVEDGKACVENGEAEPKMNSAFPHRVHPVMTAPLGAYRILKLAPVRELPL